MHVAFIFPPFAAPFLPPLGLPLLSAFLEKHCIASGINDLNIELYGRLLEPESVIAALDRLELQMRTYKRQKHLEPAEADHYLQILPVALASDYVKRGLYEALDLYYRRRGAESRFDLFRRSQVLSYALRAVALDLGHLNAHPRNPYLLIPPEAWQEIESWEAWRPHLEWYRTCLARSLQNADVVGLSVCYPTQLPFSLLTAAQIRLMAPDVKIVWGGPFVTSMVKRVTHNVPKGFLASHSNLIDAAIIEDGEYPLLDYVQSFQRGEPPSHPSIVLPDQLDEVLERQTRGPAPPLIKPAFHKLPLDRYLTPRLTLPMLTSRHCYWGKCTFCAHSIGYSRYQQYKGEEIVGHLLELEAQYGKLSVYFMDECVPPRNAFAIAAGLADAGSGIRWAADMRLERQLSREKLELLRSGGCRYIAFGLESINERVSTLMNKGTSPEVTARIVDDCGEVGIHVCLMFFCGFPSETRQEALETVHFVLDRVDRVSAVGMSHFTLCPGTEVYQQAESLGIRDIRPDGEFTIEAGMSRDESSSFRAEAGALFGERIYEGHEMYHRLFYTLDLADRLEAADDDPWPLAIVERGELAMRWRKFFGAQSLQQRPVVWEGITVDTMPFSIESYREGSGLMLRSDGRSGMVFLNLDHPTAGLCFLKPEAWKRFGNDEAFQALVADAETARYLVDQGIIRYA